MRLLHITFHKGCESEIEYILKKLGHELEVFYFDDGETTGSDLYKINHSRAQKCWDNYKDYFNTFDGIITSDTCPTSRPFLQNNWSKLLIIWVCNRFDYNIDNEYNDPEYYQLIRDIPNRKNVFIFGNTAIENIYSMAVRNVDIGDFVIKPSGKNLLSEDKYQTYENNSDLFYVPPYHNETNLMNLSEKLTSIGIQNKCERFPNHISDLLCYKGVINIPYAWSTIVFFERLQLGLVTFIPTVRFLNELFEKGAPNGWFQPPFKDNLPYESKNEMLSLSEWYCDVHKELFVFFDSWQDLKEKVNTTDYKEKTKTILEFAKTHHDIMLSRWNSVIEKYIIDKNSVSQLGQDKNVINFYKFKKNGCFIEIGASDGIELSNTYLLETQYNWKGICVEPIPYRYNKLIKNRPNSYCSNKAVYSKSGIIMDFDIAKTLHSNTEGDGDGISGLSNHIDCHKNKVDQNKETIKVETISFNDLLENSNSPSFIEYLSLDTEGSEYEILKSLNFEKYTFGLIDIEHNYVEPRRSLIRLLLQENGYIFINENVVDDRYIHSSIL
uniref:Methyltransferase FkbM domain-containing protein n=1 Tax=viral metagenome TaxID=1070528 RepID=A0A6C0DJM7_9ZZZZ